MHLTVNKFSGLRAMRRKRTAEGRLPRGRVGLLAPDPSPQVRWTVGLLPLDVLALDHAPDERHALNVAVPDARARLQGRFATSTVYSRNLPDGSFIELDAGISVSCPELAFVEAGTYMTPMAHILLGYELCGTYSRDGRNPRCGSVAFGVEPATSVERIRSYIEQAGRIRGAQRAKELLSYVADNAWSPMEAVVAALATIPATEGGYGLCEVALNRRRANAPELVKLGCKESRVPDIEIVGTRVGFNYDGRGHFGADAPGGSSSAESTDASKALGSAASRSKYLDDLRRNRELAASGAVVLPVTSEDLFQQGGLDAVMLEAVLVMEKLGDISAAKARELKAIIRTPVLQRERQRIIWSLLPWEPGDAYTRQIADRLARAGHPREVVEAEIVL